MPQIYLGHEPVFQAPTGLSSIPQENLPRFSLPGLNMFPFHLTLPTAWITFRQGAQLSSSRFCKQLFSRFSLLFAFQDVLWGVPTPSIWAVRAWIVWGLSLNPNISPYHLHHKGGLWGIKPLCIADRLCLELCVCCTASFQPFAAQMIRRGLYVPRCTVGFSAGSFPSFAFDPFFLFNRFECVSEPYL